MSAYSSQNADTSDQKFGVVAGAYECTITKAELQTNGNVSIEVDAVEISGDKKEKRVGYITLALESDNKFAKKRIDQILSVCGFNKGGNIDIGQWSEMVGKKFVALYQGVENEFEGKIKTKFQIMEYFTTQFLTPTELLEGKPSERYGVQLKYCLENPLVKYIQGGKTKSAKGTLDEDLPF